MANGLARRLQDMGVDRERFVPVSVSRSVETLAAILAVLKAGAAFVPLDPADPKERVQAVIDHTQAPVVLADPQYRMRCHEADTLWVDSSPDSVEEPAALAKVASEHAGCAYYTSGSSGEAKGVVLEHRALLNKLDWFNRNLLGERSLRLPLTGRLTFAASHPPLLVPWLRGEAVWLLDEGVVGDPVALLHALSGQAPAALHCVPQLWDAMLEAVQAGRASVPDALALVSLSGEHPSQALVDRSFAVLPDLELWNIYGATEYGIAIAGRLGPGEPLRLGEPIANVEAYVLDEDLRPVPADQVGELHIGGTGLARGYLGRRALTAERFIPHPFSDQPGARLFKTDDLVRRQEDGGFEFVARRDRVMKIRGFRVEPQEVEEAIGRHHGIARCAVTAARGTDRLVAHVVPARSPAPTLSELRAFLASRLPAHMLPSRLVALDALPTTSSGKLDRRALLDLPGAQPVDQSRAGRQTRPRNSLERRIVKLWRRILDVESVAVTDDFFELGGDSLSAVRVVSELDTRTGVALAPSALLEAPTPERLAKLVARSRPGQQPSTLVILRSGGAARPLFCVAPAGGMVMGLGRLAERIASDRAVYALQSYELRDDGGTLIETVARRYVAAMREVQPQGPYLLVGRCLGSVIALEAAQQLHSQGEQVDLLALLDGPPLARLLGSGPTSPRRDPRPRRRHPRGKRLRKIARFTWREPRRRLRHLRQALRSARDTRSSTPATVRALYRQRQRQVELRDSYAAERYAGRIRSVVSAQHHRKATRDHRYTGWDAIAGGGLERVVISGRHADLLAEPAVREVAEHLDRWLDEAEAAGDSRPGYGHDEGSVTEEQERAAEGPPRARRFPAKL
jgi:amino acid adenylation domain-containing protein